VLGGAGVAALVIAGAVTLLRREPLPSGPPSTEAPAAPPTVAAPASVPAAAVPPPTTAVAPRPSASASAGGPAPNAGGPTAAAPPLASPGAASSTTTAANVTAASPGASAAPVPSASARLDRANQLMEQGRYAQALAEARAVSAREPGNTEARVLVQDAEAALVIEDAVKAARAALKAGDRDAALVEIRRGLAVNPNDGRLLSLFREATQ
jgi:hypothetical protein